MEHPVPQNVTSFEFHLIGDMTLKQFAYLATGLGIAYLTFVLFFSSYPAFSIPVIAISSLLGAAFAFLPIYDRPLDHWVGAFFKAVYSPTQGYWKTSHQKGKINPEDNLFKNRLKFYLSGSLPAPRVEMKPAPKPTTPVLRPLAVSKFQTQIAAPVPAPQPTIQPKLQTTPPIQTKPDEYIKLAGEVKFLQTKLAEAQQQITRLQTTPPAPVIQPPKIQPQPVTVPQAQVTVIQALKPANTQILLTSFPNIINGIVSDDAGVYLEGVIVIIHDRSGVPVRAVKTNKLGQFAGATPLPSGVYTLTLEKEGYEFQILQVTLNAHVLAPIQIHPKKGEARG